MNNLQTQLFIACTMFGTIGLILSLLTYSVYDYYKKQKAIRAVFERLDRIGWAYRIGRSGNSKGGSD